MARLDAELDNIRGALDSAAVRREPELELRLAGGLWRFWWARGHVDEGLARLESALARGTHGSRARARVLRGSAGLAWSRGDLELGERRATEAVALARQVGDRGELIGAHTVLGNIAIQRKDFPTARHHHEQALAIRESLGREPVVEKLNLAVVAMDAGEPGAAVPLLEQVLDANRRSDNLIGVAGFATLNLGQAHLRLGEVARAWERFEEAREAFSEIGFRAHVAHALQGLAACAAARGRPREAAHLLGRATAELGEIVDSEEYFPELAAEVEVRAREALGDEAYEAAFSAGRTGLTDAR
jgi:tetratricopeptide (TPR) repeat protein